MTYLSLYRKYRSQTFSEVVGQEVVVRTLMNAITRDRLTHAYLFAGPRGTGKTSVARIFAKALNCRTGPTADPCGKCDLCTRVRDGAALDVIEIDAASNRGIDEIRDLREKVRFAPVEGKYKVYIIDEVHMLTAEAFNALLKTLEEPPAQVVFVLATTEPQKVPLTILSRCQRFDFARIQVKAMVNHLSQIARQEGIESTLDALETISASAEGSLRDAISLLDQLFSFSRGTITREEVLAVLGTSRREVLFDFTEMILAGDRRGVLEKVKLALAEGANVNYLTRDLLSHFRNLLMIKVGAASLLEAREEEIGKMLAQADRFSLEEVEAVLGRLNRAEQGMRGHPQPRLLLEVELLEAARVKKGVASPPELKEMVPPPAKPSPPGQNHLFLKIQQSWSQILESVKSQSIFSFVALEAAQPAGLEEDRLKVVFPKGFSFYKERLEEAAAAGALRHSLKEVLGQELNFFCAVAEEKKLTSPPAADSGSERGPTADELASFFGGKVVAQ